MSSQDGRRKRKWDVPDEKTIAAGVVAAGVAGAAAVLPPVPTFATVATDAATAAQRISAVLAAKGIIVKEPTSNSITINECRPDIRYYLTKGATHEMLYKETGATVVAKGRYKAPGDTSAEPALYLYITGNQQKNVDDATAKINQIMNGGQGVQNSPFNAKVFVGIDPLADPSFPLMGKVVGPKGSFLKHITTETGAKIQLRGRGSGFLEGPNATEAPEPLYLHIGGTTQHCVDSAKALTENLLLHVRQDYATHCESKFKPPAGFGPVPPHLMAGAFGQAPYPYPYPQAYKPPAPAYPGYPPVAPGYPYQGYPSYPAQPPATQAYTQPDTVAPSIPPVEPQQTQPQQAPHYPPQPTQPPQQAPHYPPQQTRATYSAQPTAPHYAPTPAAHSYPPQVDAYAGYHQQSQPQAPHYPAPRAPEPSHKRRFQELPVNDKKDDVPAVGPARPSAEEMAAYSLPDAVELMPPPPPVAVAKKKPNLLGTPTTRPKQPTAATTAAPTEHQPAQPKVGRTKVKSGLKSLVDYDPEGDNDDDDDEADTTDEFDHKKQKINLTPEKPKAPAARPFWALGEAFSAPVIQPTAEEQRKSSSSSSSSSRHSDNKYDDVYKDLGIKKHSR